MDFYVYEYVRLDNKQPKGKMFCFLPLKRQTKIAADDILTFDFYLSKEIRLDFSCESSV